MSSLQEATQQDKRGKNNDLFTVVVEATLLPLKLRLP